MPPSPTVKEAKRIRKESGAARFDLIDPTTKIGKLIGDGDQHNPALVNMSNFSQDSNLSTGTLTISVFGRGVEFLIVQC